MSDTLKLVERYADAIVHPGFDPKSLRPKPIASQVLERGQHRIRATAGEPRVVWAGSRQEAAETLGESGRRSRISMRSSMVAAAKASACRRSSSSRSG